MTKKEFFEALKNGKSVYSINERFGDIIEHKYTLDYAKRINFTNEILKEFFATKDEALHYLKHGNIRRTEVLPFITYKEFKKFGFISFKSKNGDDCILGTFNGSEIYVCEAGQFSFKAPLNKENFYKAYDICVKLFVRDVEQELEELLCN